MRKMKYFIAIISLFLILCGITACGATELRNDINWKKIYAVHDGLAVATDGYKYGFVDESGNTKLEPKWRNATFFSCGRAFVQEDEPSQNGGYYWRVIDDAGNYVCPYNSMKYYGIIYPYIQDYAVVVIDEKFFPENHYNEDYYYENDSLVFIIDRDGLPIHKEPILSVLLWQNGSLQLDGFFNVMGEGLMNTNGDIVIPLGSDMPYMEVRTYMPDIGENGFPQGEMTIFNTAGLIEVSYPDSQAGLYRADGEKVVSFTGFKSDQYSEQNNDYPVSNIDNRYYYGWTDAGDGVFRMDGSVIIDPAEGIDRCIFLDGGSIVADSSDEVKIYNAKGEIVARTVGVAKVNSYEIENKTVVWMLGEQGNGWSIAEKDESPVIKSYESLDMDYIEDIYEHVRANKNIYEDASEYIFTVADGNIIDIWGNILVKDVEMDENGDYKLWPFLSRSSIGFSCRAGGQTWLGSKNWSVPIGQAMVDTMGYIYYEDTLKVGYATNKGIIQPEWDLLIPLRDYVIAANINDTHFRLYDYSGRCLDKKALPFDDYMKKIYADIINDEDVEDEDVGIYKYIYLRNGKGDEYISSWGNMIVIRDGNGNRTYLNLSGNEVDPTHGGEFELYSTPYIQRCLAIIRDDKAGILSLDGSRVIVEPMYDYFTELDDSGWIVTKDELDGIVGEDGQIIVPAEYEYIYQIQELGIYAAQNEIDGRLLQLDLYSKEGVLLAQTEAYSSYLPEYLTEGLRYTSSNTTKLATNVLVTSDHRIYSDTYCIIDGVCYGRSGADNYLNAIWGITARSEDGKPLCGNIGAADERVYEE